MHAQIRLGRIGGISIGLHYSWFIIAFLIILSLIARFSTVMPQWSSATVWTAAIITGLLFFVTLLLHELAHSLLAKSIGLRVRAITLFALGGVSQIESEAPDAKSEFWIAIVGPLSSLVIGFVCLLLARSTGWMYNGEPRTPVSAVLVWLGYINLVLAAFNMIPGYPLDGGRVLRALIWWGTKSIDRSTRIAAKVGQTVAFLFIFFGLYQFFLGKNFGGLWLAFIGWFLLDASRSSYAQVEITEGLRDRKVADIMDRDFATVEAHLSLEDFVHQYLLVSGRRCFVVVQNGNLAGLITTNEVRRVEKDRWPQTSVQSVMRPLSQLQTVTPDTAAITALEVMTRQDINQLPVVSSGQLLGIVSRSSVMAFLHNRAELFKH
ncbi:MAG: site-2 protease family protein [Candidatus Korobacteraceae bacterium]